jgi:hypothetical protein
VILLPSLDFFVINDLRLDFFALPSLCPPNCTFRSLYRMLKAFAPMVEKLFVRLWLTASTAVMIAIRAIMPNAMITTVMPVRNRLLFMVL